MNNPLTDVLPDAARKYLYAAAFVVLLVVAAWQAAEGNWLNFAALLAGSLTNATAASNVTAAPQRRGRVPRR